MFVVTEKVNVACFASFPSQCTLFVIYAASGNRSYYQSRVARVSQMLLMSKACCVDLSFLSCVSSSCCEFSG